MSYLARRLRVAGGSQYAQIVRADGPYAYWRLDETTGSIAADYSGHQRDGTYVASVLLAQGKLLLASPNTAYMGLTGAGSGYVDVSAANGLCGG